MSVLVWSNASTNGDICSCSRICWNSSQADSLVDCSVVSRCHIRTQYCSSALWISDAWLHSKILKRHRKNGAYRIIQFTWPVVFGNSKYLIRVTSSFQGMLVPRKVHVCPCRQLTHNLAINHAFINPLDLARQWLLSTKGLDKLRRWFSQFRIGIPIVIEEMINLLINKSFLFMLFRINRQLMWTVKPSFVYCFLQCLNYVQCWQPLWKKGPLECTTHPLCKRATKSRCSENGYPFCF